MLTMTIPNIALLGVFANIDWVKTVNRHFLEKPNELYWLPWGNRQRGLSMAMAYLVRECGWQMQERSNNHGNYKLYRSPCPTDTVSFFHHESKLQNGDGKIHHQFEIRFVLMGYRPFGPTGNISHTLIEAVSCTWMGISRTQSAFRMGKPMDFASDFDISYTKGRQKRQMHETKDALRLHDDIAIVQHFSHGQKYPCNCPHCMK